MKSLGPDSDASDISTKNIGLAELAGAFKISVKQLERQLALYGWNAIFSEAERLAHREAFDNGHFKTKVNSLDELKAPLHWRHVVEATKTIFPHITDLPAERVPSPKDQLEGYVYVLFNGVTRLSKIGCTREKGARQRAIMGAHENVLVNALNVKVSDYRATEAKCHKHFQEFRTNGEWFSADVQDIINYIASEVDWLELDHENPARMTQYILACRQGDMKAAKRALVEKMF
jgi:hypothetical protein